MTTVVYTKPSCPQCVVVKAKLKQAGVEFSEVDISLDTETLLWLKSKGHKALPVVYSRGEHVVDYTSLIPQ